MTATSGRRCLERFTRSSPDGSWQKMFPDSLLCKTDWYSRECALAWKLKVTKFSRLLFQLVPKVRRTEGTGFGLLRSPQAGDADHGGPNARDSSGHPHLTSQIAMLPTPKGTPSGPDYARKIQEGSGGDDLETKLGKNTGMKLQPAFVEWMMDYPEGWTELID